MSMQNPMVTDVSRSKVPLMGLILLVLAGIVTAGVIGAAVAASSVYLIYAILVFPLLMGALAGGAIGWAAKAGRVRSVPIVILFAVLTGLLMYGVYRYGEYLLTRQQAYNDIVNQANGQLTPDQIQQGIDKVFIDEGGAPGFIGFVNFTATQGVGLKFGSYSSVSDNSPASLVLTGTAAWVYWGVEILLIVVFAAALGRKAVMIPFCEKDNRFFAEKTLGRVPREAADQFMALAKSGNWKAAASLMTTQQGKMAYPHLAISVQKCPDCNTNNVPLKAIRKINARKSNDKTIFKTTLTPAQYSDLAGEPAAAPSTVPMGNLA